jgi:exonuclease V
VQEWCEKQVEFSITRGKPQKTEAMKAGSARHVELEIEVRNFDFLQFVK